MIVALYGIIFVLSLLLPVGYLFLVKKKQEEHWLLILFLSVCVVNLGYLLLSLSKTVAFALFANKVTYFGQVLVPLCMFMLVSKLSGFVYRKWVRILLFVIAMVMFSLVLTTGHLDWYYKSVELTFADGAGKLVKEYGVLHPVNLIYVLAYFVAMLAVIALSFKKNSGHSQKLLGLMLIVVIGNVGGWIFEKLIPWNFEFLAVSYFMSEFVFFFVYWMLQDYVHKGDLPVPTGVTQEPVFPDIATMPMDVKIRKVLSSLKSGETLGTREREILVAILENKKRKEIASQLCLSENTIKTYTRSLYAKLGIGCREELYALLLK